MDNQTTEAAPGTEPLLTVGMFRAWQERHRNLTQSIAALEDERRLLSRRIEAAKVLVEAIDAEP